MANRFDKKVAVVTGAGSGIGFAIALRLAEEGANIVALDLSENGLLNIQEAVSQAGKNCATIKGNVEDVRNIASAIEIASGSFGRLDYLVNNAGISGPLQRFDKVSPEDFDKLVAINLKPVWYGIGQALAPMRKAGGGAILNVASMAGIRPNRQHALYGMTKAAMISLTHHAAMDYATFDVRVNCLCPGPVDTPIFQQLESAVGSQAYDAARTGLLRRTLLNRFGSSEEQAAAAAFLLSDEASFITGIAMPVDGGWSISDGQTR